MYVVFFSGGKQYRTQLGQTVRLEKINYKTGEKIEFNNVLMIADEKKIQLGTPNILNTCLSGNIIQHGRHKKIKIIKFNRRKHYKKQQGHRQYFTDVKITNLHHAEK